MKTPMQELIEQFSDEDIDYALNWLHENKAQLLEKEKQCICTAYRNGIFNHVTVYSVEDSINEAKQYYTDLTNQ